MNGNARYRFLPWVRSGLAKAIEKVDAIDSSGGGGTPLPVRAKFLAGITVSEGISETVDLTLYGPGDILGIDPRLIVQTTPVAGTPNFEPNFLPAIDFDPPDFVWMFTPAKADTQNRLRPWLALVVVEREVVGLPQVRPNHPLPVLDVPAGTVAQELPDLTDSWAWAHTQMMTNEDGQGDLQEELAEQPDLNVSRLVAPRRLKPDQHYVACLVPAFEPGRQRGLGNPDPGSTLEPAWDTDQAGGVELPVYFHWEFATGPLGDFESLASKLQPFKTTGTVGVVEMYTGDPGDPIYGADDNPNEPLIPPSEEEATILMDGVLRAPSEDAAGDGGGLADIAKKLRNRLSAVLNAPASQLESQQTAPARVLAPPIYGQWHAQQHTVTDNSREWLRELNLDPRRRVAAGLGAEVVRRYQEEFVQQCWEQVGEVLKANEQLSWGRLSLEASQRIFERHYRPLPTARFLQMTTPLHRRTLQADATTILSRIGQTSMPAAMADQAFRRTISPQRPLIRRTARRLRAEERLSDSFTENMRSTLVEKMAAGDPDVDPTRFTPDGLAASVLLEKLVNQEPVPVPGIEINPVTARNLRAEAQQFADVSFQEEPLTIEVRDDITRTGLVTARQIDSVRLLEDRPDQESIPRINMHATIAELLEMAVQEPEADGVLISLSEGDVLPVLKPIRLGSGGEVLIADPGSTAGTVAGNIDVGSLGDRTSITDLLAALPVGVFSTTGAAGGDIGANREGELVVADPVSGSELFRLSITDGILGVGLDPIISEPPPEGLAPPPAPRTKTVPLPAKDDTEAIERFKEQMTETIQALQLNEPVSTGSLVAFPLPAVRDKLDKRVNPLVMIRRRLQQIVNLETGDLWEQAETGAGVALPDTKDRLVASPVLPAPMYEFLAETSSERFLPGAGTIPPDSITVLQTNPRFIEAFMVGLNTEMNRELLWRRYPTEQHGTPFRFFWDWEDGKPDLEQPIQDWDKPLGSNLRSDGNGSQVVLLIRGELLQRYPNTVIQAWKAANNNLVDPPGEQDVREPIFQGKFEPEIAFAGFDLTPEVLRQDPGWFFVLQQQPTQPRFGFDLADLETGGVAEGQHFAPDNQALLDAGNSAEVASKTLQKPFRIAVHAKHILKITD
jgi:hypothetical protein